MKVNLDEPRRRYAFLIATSVFLPEHIERLHDKIVLSFAERDGFDEQAIRTAAADLAALMQESLR